MKVHEALQSVMADVSVVRKKERNANQNFNFRGIDAVLNVVGPAFRDHGVMVLPTVIESHYEQVEIGDRRKPTGHSRLLVQYLFVGPEGDSLSCTVAAEALDLGDKATAKAMSVALRTALLQSLAIPTDEPDPDHDSYERSPAADLLGLVEAATSLDELRAVYRQAHGDRKVLAAVEARRAEIEGGQNA